MLHHNQDLHTKFIIEQTVTFAKGEFDVRFIIVRDFNRITNVEPILPPPNYVNMSPFKNYLANRLPQIYCWQDQQVIPGDIIYDNYQTTLPKIIPYFYSKKFGNKNDNQFDNRKLIEKFIETVKLEKRNIIEVTNPDLKFKYFYQSSGTSREGSNLKGYVLPTDIKPFALQLGMSGIDFRFTNLEDNALFDISNLDDYCDIDFNIDSMSQYLRFMNKDYASICKYITNQLK